MEYSFSKDLEYSKEVLNLSEEKFSELIGVSRSTYNRWKNGSIVPNRLTMERVYSSIYSNGINLACAWRYTFIKDEITKSD